MIATACFFAGGACGALLIHPGGQRAPVLAATDANRALETLLLRDGRQTFRIETLPSEPDLPLFCADGVDPAICKSISVATWQEALRLHAADCSDPQPP